MTGTASTPRTDCPPWCTSKHALDHRLPGPVHVGSAGRWVPLTGNPDASLVYAVIVRRYDDDSPRLAVHGFEFGDHSDDPSVPVNLADAGHLARLVEMLADATPEAHHSIAAAIRRAEAVARGDAEPVGRPGGTR